MIFKHFLMGFGGVATVTGVGIGVYYGTNSSENARQDVEAFKSSSLAGEKQDEEEQEEKSKDDATSQSLNK